APFSSSPGSRYPHPAGTVFIPCAVAIPVKLKFNPAVFVGINFIPRFADYHGGLHTLDSGFWCVTYGTEDHLRRKTANSNAIVFLPIFVVFSAIIFPGIFFIQITAFECILTNLRNNKLLFIISHIFV